MVLAMNEFDLFILDPEETYIDEDQQESWFFAMAKRREEDERHAPTAEEPQCMIVDLN